jgi:hypothetical protein
MVPYILIGIYYADLKSKMDASTVFNLGHYGKMNKKNS